MRGLTENRVTTISEGDESIDILMSQNRVNNIQGNPRMMVAQVYGEDYETTGDFLSIYFTADKVRELMNHCRAFLALEGTP